MYFKSDFIQSHQDTIDKEVKEVIEDITKSLKENGFCQIGYSLDGPAGIVLAIANDVKLELEQYGWNVNVEANPNSKTIKFLVQ
ncbi:hypothetical protein [Shewanella sp. GD03713]|uniref:hypothetical protein n=1 Tax=Shewanella sp. GD03713 TaxID=2975372 RepID=UPI000B3443F4|nr:hypothetical protein [Shewanella sp. GD03713]QXN23207.1 hypothetical protein KVP08_011090 [Shewanella putrefaciens]MDH1470434.1 hypothetical protein [Shewanella sp. GD03713]VEE64360.1 Uncharacterised protein [Shewanella putrefaciens]VEE64366.1 Uncharacterised protein [Shewanella putrefaciens]VEE64372.1 Uncharacterised protein [Shewanella putrefaciens]